MSVLRSIVAVVLVTWLLYGVLYPSNVEANDTAGLGDNNNINREFDVVPATDHPTMAADPSTAAAFKIVGMLDTVKVSSPTMTGTVKHLKALRTKALPTEEDQEATTVVAVLDAVVMDLWF